MPEFYYQDGYGKRKRIFPHYPAPLTKGFIVCENEKAEQILVAQQAIETVNTPEEIQEAIDKKKEQDLRRIEIQFNQ